MNICQHSFIKKIFIVTIKVLGDTAVKPCHQGASLDSFQKNFFLNKFILLFIYLFLAALGLGCCVRAFSCCGKRGLLFVAVPGLLIVVASLVVEHGL